VPLAVVLHVLAIRAVSSRLRTANSGAVSSDRGGHKLPVASVDLIFDTVNVWAAFSDVPFDRAGGAVNSESPTFTIVGLIR
jgi:hypothetical protein